MTAPKIVPPQMVGREDDEQLGASELESLVAIAELLDGLMPAIRAARTVGDIREIDRVMTEAVAE